MEPFRIACPHCASKIIVRHPQLLGHRLPCPKCQGDVDVPENPPVSTTMAARNVATALNAPPIVNSAAMTKDGDPDWDSILADEQLLAQAARDAEASQRFVPEPSVSEVQIPLSGPSQAPPIHGQVWQSSSVAKRRQMLTLATLAITSSLLAIGGFVLFLRTISKRPLEANPTVAVKQVPAKKSEPEATIQTPIAPESAEPKDPDPNPVLEPTNNNIEVVSTPIPSSPVAEVAPLAPIADPQTVLAESSNFSDTAKTVDPNSSNASKLDGMSDIFKGFEDLLKNDSVMSEAGFGKNAIPNELDIQDAEILLEDAYHPLAKQIPNWEDRGKLPFAAVTLKNISLHRSIELISSMTGIGITLDWQSLRVANIDASASVQLDEKGTTVADLVSKLIETHSLEWNYDPKGMPIVSASRLAMESKLPTDWTIAGVFPLTHEAECIDLLRRLWGLEDVCTLVSGKLIWTEQATPIEKANMLASMLDLVRLRSVSVPNCFSKVEPNQRLFSSEAWRACIPALGTKVPRKVIASEKKPIPELLYIAGKETKLNVWIDWQNVWQHGLVPNELAVSILRDRTFPQIANRYLTDYALDLVPIDEDDVWITTAEVRRKLIRVLPVAMPKGGKMDDLVQSIRMLAPRGADDRTRFRVVAIPGLNDMVFVRICTPKAEQLSDPDIEASFGWIDK